MRISSSCPPSRLYVKSGLTVSLSMNVSGPSAFSTHSVCAWTLIRNAPAPNAAEASTIPVVSHAPQLPSARPSTSVPSPSAVWSILTTTSGEPENGTYQSRAVVALGSVEFGGNCWLDPGSSATKRPVCVVSTLSGWWISFRVLTGKSSPSTAMLNESTTFGSSGSSTIFHTRPFVEIPGPENGATVGAVPLPESTT